MNASENIEEVVRSVLFKIQKEERRRKYVERTTSALIFLGMALSGTINAAIAINIVNFVDLSRMPFLVALIFLATVLVAVTLPIAFFIIRGLKIMGFKFVEEEVSEE